MAHGESHGMASRPEPAARIGCLMVADFAAAALVRANPELRDRPFALTRTAARNQSGARRARGAAQFHPHSELAQVSPRARAAGVRSGMTVAQARALIPDLTVMSPSAAAERAAADALIDVAESISPVVEESAPGCVWIDLAGTARFYRHAIGAGDPQEAVEQEMATELVRRARRVGLEAAAGIGAGKEIARLAARCGGVRVIAPGREREFLDWIPLDLLELGCDERGEDLDARLKRLGIGRLGELARLDARAVGSRFGARGIELMRLARGESGARVAARARVELFAEARELDYGIETLEPLGFVMRAMIGRLTERLALRGLVAGDIMLSLGLADRRRDDRRITVAAATNEVRALLTLVNLNLETAPPAAAVESIRLTIEPRVPRPAQADMFLPPTPAPERLEAAIARIAALCGPDHVGRLTPADSYRPEAVRLDPFVPPPPAAAAGCAAPAQPNAVVRMVMRTVRPPEEVEVMCTRAAPEFVRGRRISARVVSAAGPWRRQGEWWARTDDTGDGEGATPADGLARSHAPAAYARDYYDLALADGAIYRVYYDAVADKWFVDGIYD